MNKSEVSDCKSRSPKLSLLSNKSLESVVFFNRENLHFPYNSISRSETFKNHLKDGLCFRGNIKVTL